MEAGSSAVPKLPLASLKQSLVSSLDLSRLFTPLSTNRPVRPVEPFSTRRNPLAFSSEGHIVGGGRTATADEIFSMWMENARQSLKRDAYGSAIVQYTQALRVRPGDQQALLGRFRCFVRLGDLLKARADAESLLVTDKDNIPGLMAMAEVLAALKKYNMAKIYISRGLKLRPDSKALKRAMADVDARIVEEHESVRHKGHALVISLEAMGRPHSPAPLYGLRGREAYRARTAEARAVARGLAASHEGRLHTAAAALPSSGPLDSEG